MWLLKIDTLQLELFIDDRKTPPCVILSHIWGSEELTFQDIQGGNFDEQFRNRTGYKKLEGCCAEASSFGFEHVWIDTCCIIQTHHRRHRPTKTVAYAAENGGRMYIASQYKCSNIPYRLPFPFETSKFSRMSAKFRLSIQPAFHCNP